MNVNEIRVEIALFASAFWMSVISIIFPIALLIIFNILTAIAVWLLSVIVLGMILTLTLISDKSFHIWIPLILFPIAIYFIVHIMINLIAKSATDQTSEISAFVKPYHINWKIFNIFYFLSKKELYKFKTDDVERFAHHKLIYHKPFASRRRVADEPNTIIELVDKEDYALLLLEIGGQG